MNRRLTLAEMRREILARLDLRHWRTATDLQHALGLGGHEWYRVCLVLERLAADGEAELRGQRTRVRRFRLPNDDDRPRRSRIHVPPRDDADDTSAGRSTR